MAGILTVHVIGAGFGESIILEFPNGSVGVIDCFSPKLDLAAADRIKKNPTLHFLVEELRADRLAFVAFTHPHEDHGRGLSHILEEYRNRIDQIWIFDAFQAISLERYFKALLLSDRRLPIESLLDDPPGIFSVELMKIKEAVFEQCALSNPNRADICLFNGPKPRSIPGEPVMIRLLGPSEALCVTYKERLAENLMGLLDDDGEIAEGWDPTNVNHNIASPAIVIEFGKSRILLAGDMERLGWEEVWRDYSNDGSLSSLFVKVSHHGSETGYHDELYPAICANGPVVGVLTPFNRHSKPLPTRAGIDYLEGQLQELLTTSLQVAQRTQGIVEPLTMSEIRRFKLILDRWNRRLSQMPDLWSVMDPDFSLASTGEVPVSGSKSIRIPREWVEDLAEHPRLSALIHPDLRSSYMPKIGRLDDIDTHYRASFRFDELGNEVQRHLGNGAGSLI